MPPGVVFHGWQDPQQLEPQLERLRALAPGAKALVVVDDGPSRDLLEPLLREGDALVKNDGPLGCGARQQAGFQVGLRLALDPLLTLPRGMPAEVVQRLIAALRRAPVAVGVAAGRGGFLGALRDQGLAWAQRQFSGLGLTGPPSGCLGVRAEALSQVSWEALSPGSVFDLELTLALAERGLSLQEVPVPRVEERGVDWAALSARATALAGLGRLRGRLAFPGPAPPPQGEAPSVGRTLPRAEP